MCGIIDAVGEFFKTAVACVCFLLIGGPVLLIMGSIFIRQEDSRVPYNAAVKAFDSKPIESWVGNINNVPVSIRRESLNPSGVESASSVFMHAVVPLPNADTPSTFTVSVNVNNVKPFVRRFETKIIKTFRPESVTGPGQHNKDTMSEFYSRCASKGGTVGQAPSCIGVGNRCLECVFDQYLKGVYLVVSETSPGHYAEDPTLKSALYNFGETANDYSKDSSPTVDVRLYSSKDPRIALERYTKGHGFFGISPRTAGIAMIVVGSILVLIEIFACTAVIYYFCIRKESNDAGAAGNGVPAAPGPYSAYTPGNPPSNYYGEQPQSKPPGYGYGQPPPAQGYQYGQPPPAQGYGYGQPPPAQGYEYGQPPPAQGYGYGQPPPAQGYEYGQPPPAQGYGHGYPPQAQGYGYGQPPQAQGNEYKPGPI